MAFVPVETVRPAAERTFEERARAIRELLPAAAVEHIGATAIPGALTKGDLDLLVRGDYESYTQAKGAFIEALLAG
jgi:GrpB-like predicted nucleotidyltransferase (UPF0157 family)